MSTEENKLKEWKFQVQGYAADGSEWASTVCLIDRTLDNAEVRARRVTRSVYGVTVVRLILLDRHEVCFCFEQYVCTNHRDELVAS